MKEHLTLWGPNKWQWVRGRLGCDLRNSLGDQQGSEGKHPALLWTATLPLPQTDSISPGRRPSTLSVCQEGGSLTATGQTVLFPLQPGSQRNSQKGDQESSFRHIAHCPFWYEEKVWSMAEDHSTDDCKRHQFKIPIHSPSHRPLLGISLLWADGWYI